MRTAECTQSSGCWWQDADDSHLRAAPFLTVSVELERAGTGRVGPEDSDSAYRRSVMLGVGANDLDVLAPIVGVREDDVVDHAPALAHRFLEPTPDIEPVSV